MPPQKPENAKPLINLIQNNSNRKYNTSPNFKIFNPPPPALKKF
jgi:hypothetical protein